MANSFDDKIKKIENASDDLETIFEAMANELFESIVSGLASNLDVKDGSIETSADNFKQLNAIDNIYDDFIKNNAAKLAKQIYSNVQSISGYNIDYFSQFDDNPRSYQATVDDVKQIIDNRLGISAKGSSIVLKKGGYIDSLLSDNTIKNQIKDLSVKEVTSGSGFNNFKKQLSNLIVGDPDTLGGFQQFYKNYAYDVYVNVDRLESNLIASDVGLTDFIYAGTIIKTSREFCVNNVGKLFTVTEAEQWRALIGKFRTEPGKRPGTTRRLPIGPIVQDAASYNPTQDLGGIGCRHIPRWISKEAADAIRGKN